MKTYTVEVTEVIKAPPAQVYAVISDYEAGHHAILPPRYFESMRVVSGGQGAGTVLEVSMNVYGANAQFNLTVSEPEPGRVLVEEDPAAGTKTTFSVEPLNDGRWSQVTIQTTARTSPGIKGILERLMNPPITRRIYREELGRLGDYVAGGLVNQPAM